MFPLLSVCEAKPAIKIPTKIYGHLEIPKSWRVQLQLWSTELSLNNLAQQPAQSNGELLFMKYKDAESALKCLQQMNAAI